MKDSCNKQGEQPGRPGFFDKIKAKARERAPDWVLDILESFVKWAWDHILPATSAGKLLITIVVVISVTSAGAILHKSHHPLHIASDVEVKPSAAPRPNHSDITSQPTKVTPDVIVTPPTTITDQGGEVATQASGAEISPSTPVANEPESIPPSTSQPCDPKLERCTSLSQSVGPFKTAVNAIIKPTCAGIGRCYARLEPSPVEYEFGTGAKRNSDPTVEDDCHFLNNENLTLTCDIAPGGQGSTISVATTSDSSITELLVKLKRIQPK